MRHRTIAAEKLMGMVVVLAWPARASAHRYGRGPALVHRVGVVGPVYRVRRSPPVRRLRRVYRGHWVRPILPPPMFQVRAEPIVGVTVTPGYPVHPGYRHYAEEVVVDCHW